MHNATILIRLEHGIRVHSIYARTRRLVLEQPIVASIHLVNVENVVHGLVHGHVVEAHLLLVKKRIPKHDGIVLPKVPLGVTRARTPSLYIICCSIWCVLLSIQGYVPVVILISLFSWRPEVVEEQPVVLKRVVCYLH